MAGLLDFGSNPYAGLLSEEDLAGARRQATTDALLKLSSGLFQAGAPSRTPQSLGAALVGGLQGVGAGYQGTLQQAAQQKLMQQKLQADLQSKQRTANAQKLVGGLYSPAQAGQAAQPAPYLAGAPYGIATPAKPATPGGINQDVMSQLMALGPEGQKAIMDALAMRKATQGEAFNLGEGDVRYITDLSGVTTKVAAGVPKKTETALDKKTLSPDALAIMQSQFKTRNFENLTVPQQQLMIQYENAPTDAEVANLKADYAKVGYETPGFNAPVPQSKSQVANQIFSSATQPSQTAAQNGQPAPVATRPFTRDAGGGVQVTPEFAKKPMGAREVPLIESSALSLRDKKELIIAKPKTTQAVETSLNSNRRLRRALIQLRDTPGMASAFGFTGEFVSGISGTDAANAKAILEQIEGKAFITAIGDMRNASATGAAVGSVTEQEGAKLQRSFTTLKQSQSPSAARQEIDNMISVLDESEGVTVNAYARTYGQPNFNLIDGGKQTFKVTLPNGKSVEFPNKESLDQYKKAAGL